MSANLRVGYASTAPHQERLTVLHLTEEDYIIAALEDPNPNPNATPNTDTNPKCYTITDTKSNTKPN